MQASDFNPFSPTVRANPYPYYEVLRETAPVYWNEQLRVHLVSRFEDVLFVTKSPALFSSKRSLVREEQYAAAETVAPVLVGTLRRGSMLTADPPIHTRLRNLVSRAFTPRRVADMEPFIRRLSRELISQLPESGEFDLMKELAEPLPIIVIAEMLGVEPARRLDFKRWSDDTVASTTVLLNGGDPALVEPGIREMRDYLEGVIAARRKEPRDDLISALLENGEKEGVLTAETVVDFCRLLLVAGNETTTNLLGNGMRALLSNPEQLERLTAEPALIPNAVEEMLRYDSPVQAVSRYVLQDVEIAGTRIPAGSNVMTLLGSANRDPRKYTDPERFDVTRNAQGMVSFGHGIHFCLGAPLARLEAKVALEELLEPGRRFSFAPGQRERVEITNHFSIRGPKALRLRAEATGPVRATA
ncbi:cytochrome P450 [Archangium violaceum]|uniref:cytochrome P450 n=1 Tax=Archangium violaceum TaxID=83451 RepID=UPI00194EB0B1|nr:cytochrome P450 [Archangium violaceum]QRN96627.1 cytochrome P450 [Archangium violaceum]